MTRKEAKDYIREWCPYDRQEEIIKALEQEPILDKIRSEIEDTGAYEQEVNGKTEFLKGITYCLDIIDKYKAEESEERYADSN